jgi:hypothetical protein
MRSQSEGLGAADKSVSIWCKIQTIPGVAGSSAALPGWRPQQRGVRRPVTNFSDEVSDDEVDEGVGR